MLKIIVDGACRGNPGSTGWAAVLVRDDEILSEVSDGSTELGTNNVAEMEAILLGLNTAPNWITKGETVSVVSDSELCIGYLAKGWRGKNARLLRYRLEIRKAERALGAEVFYEKGGIEDELFQLVDVLAKDAVPDGQGDKGEQE